MVANVLSLVSHAFKSAHASPRMQRLVHMGEHWAHVAYLAAASAEMRGLYSGAALTLLVCVLASKLFHVEA
jgi:hypothetical protein